MIFNSKYGQKLCFIGGTALRLVYDNKRFSEDLNFDNFGLSYDEFDKLTNVVKIGLELEGLEVEMRNIAKGAYHCHIKLSNILYESGLAPMLNEKLLILIDTMPQGYLFEPERIALKKFETLILVNVVSKELLLAQKLYTVLNRKTAKGRDFFDILFLISQNISPEKTFLELKLGESDLNKVKLIILKHCETLDLKALCRDVQPFLFNPNDTKVAQFVEYFKSVKW